MDSIQFIKVRKMLSLTLTAKGSTLTEHSDFVGFSKYETSTLLLANRRITTAMFSIVWNLFALQIWNHYDSDMSGYLDGDEIDAFLRDMLQQQGCSASTQLIKDYKQFIVRFYVLNCNIYVIVRYLDARMARHWKTMAMQLPFQSANVCVTWFDQSPQGRNELCVATKLILKNFKRR